MEETYNSLTINSDLTQVDQDDLRLMFGYALAETNLPMIEKIRQCLGYSDEFIWYFAISTFNPVMVEYYSLKIDKGRFQKPVNTIIEWSNRHHHGNIMETVKLCIKYQINLTFKHEPKIVVQKLMSTDDPQIWDYLMYQFPQFQHLSNAFILTFSDDMGIYVDLTYLALAVDMYAFNCLLRIINSSACFNEFHIPYSTDCGNINETLDEHHLEHSLEYGLRQI